MNEDSAARSRPDGLSMESQYWQEVEAIFSEASALSAALRGPLLDERCAHRPEVRAEVESLLAAHDRARTFITPATVPAGAVAMAGEMAGVGSQVGAFRLVARLGEGGMGTVFLAERTDGEFDQRVAIKLIGSWLHGPDAINRFRVERQILASLHHPNIVTLLDGGVTPQGQAYLVMEYVDGLPITTYCAARTLPLRDRLVLFRQVCAAVQFAHGHLIVHRDLKPANLLVTASGLPIVLDFGVAKLLDAPAGAAEATRTGQLPGPLTPNYASPEQLRGLPVTTACDVYALGVLLYELLTGTRPYRTDGKTFDEVLALATARSRASRPSLAGAPAGGTPPIDRRALAGDLDAIVLKAMDPNSAQRYASASELADDVGRYLEDKPIVAREPSVAYLARKMAGRHRVATLVGLVSLAVVLTTLAVAVWQWRTARRAQARAEARFADVRQLANALIFKIHDAVEPLAGSTPVRQLIVAEGLTYLDRLAAESKEDALALELAKAYRRIGSIQGGGGVANLGNREAAIASMRKALATLAIPTSADDPARLALERGHINTELSLILSATGRHDEAVSSAQEAIGIAEGLATGSALRYEAKSLLARAYSAMSGIVDANESLPYRLKFLETQEAILAERPEDRVNQRNVALALKYVGAYYDFKKDTARALEHYSRAATLDEARLAAQPSDRTAQFDVAIDLSNIAGIERRAGRLPKALEYYTRSLAIRRQLAESDPKDTFARGRVAFVEARVGAVHGELGHRAEAFAHLERAVAIAREQASDDAGEEASVLAEYLQDLAWTQLEFNRRAEGCANYQEAHRLLTRFSEKGDVAFGSRSTQARGVADAVRRGLEICRGR